MENNMTTNSNSQQNTKLDFRSAVQTYMAYWKWFLLGVIISLLCAFVYLYFASTSYEVSSTILINDNTDNRNNNSEISVFEDLGLFSGPNTSLDTEIGVLKSKTLIERVVRELELNITYYTKTDIRYKELYKDDIPFNISFFMSESELKRLSQVFFFIAKSETEFALYTEEDIKICDGAFGKRTSCEFGEFIITPKDINTIKPNQSILVKIGNIEDVAIAYKKRINIAVDGPKSNLLTLTLREGIRLKARAVLDSLISYYNEDAIAYKTQLSKDTDEFITNRIDDILVELTSFDDGVETYKIENRLSNIDSEANLVLESNASVANQIVELSSQLQIINYLITYLSENKNEVIPPNLGLTNENANQNSIRYNNLILDKKRLLRGANKENPIIINLDEQINSLRISIEQNLINTRSSLRFSLNQAKRQENDLDSKISQNPIRQRDIRDIERQQEIFETLYLYLLQKREENSISLAVTTPYAKIVDKAYGISTPVSPKKRNVFIIALLIGLLIPFALVYLRLIFDNKIHSIKTIEENLDIPTLGEIPISKSKQHVIGIDGTTEHSSESFRLLRTNLNHILSGTEKKGQTIMITSTLKNEGKSFIAMNLAYSFANINKRILLIDADLRNSNSGISKFINAKQEVGLTQFLSEDNIKLENLILHNKKMKMDILESGHHPKKHEELFNDEKFEELLSFARENYDYIIIDTPAVNSTTDTLLMANLADVFVYVIRANYLDKEKLEIPKRLHQTNKLNNMVSLLNYTNPKGVRRVKYN
nr:polysaccharide biosynthesis tyrosine autokinase [uncultured Psychroserpens sp.]